MEVCLIIYELTYYSDGYKVKGYLGVPPSFPLETQFLSKKINEYYKSNELTVEPVACSINDRPSQSATPAFPDSIPALIYCRGGIGNFGRVRLHWIEQFASLGSAVFAPTYRGNEGSEGKDEFGGSDNKDVLQAIHMLKSFPFINPNHISIMGFSRGAINAAYAASHVPDLRALILWSGVSDLAQTYIERPDLRKLLRRLLKGTPTQQPEAYIKRSPIHMAGDIRCPTRIIHGTLDEQVHISHGLNMAARLNANHLPYTIDVYEDQGHLFPETLHKTAVRRMLDWIGQL